MTSVDHGIHHGGQIRGTDEVDLAEDADHDTVPSDVDRGGEIRPSAVWVPLSVDHRSRPLLWKALLGRTAHQQRAEGARHPTPPRTIVDGTQRLRAGGYPT